MPNHKALNLKPVIQNDATGCAFASVAVITQLPYKVVKETAVRLGISVDDTKLWSKTTYIRCLLQHFGVQTSSDEVPFTSWSNLPHLALLSTKWHLENGHPFWHWVVFWRDKKGAVVVDSNRALQTNICTDFEHINPKWSIPLSL